MVLGMFDLNSCSNAQFSSFTLLFILSLTMVSVLNSKPRKTNFSTYSIFQFSIVICSGVGFLVEDFAYLVFRLFITNTLSFDLEIIYVKKFHYFLLNNYNTSRVDFHLKEIEFMTFFEVLIHLEFIFYNKYSI